jgi:hypothetical protein
LKEYAKQLEDFANHFADASWGNLKKAGRKFDSGDIEGGFKEIGNSILHGFVCIKSRFCFISFLLIF